MRTTTCILFALLLTGCDHKQQSIVPTAPTTPPVPPTVTVCAPFELGVSVDKDMAGPYAILRFVPRVDGFRTDELQATGWQLHDGKAEALPGTVQTFRVPAHNDHHYRVTGLVRGCWSNWYEFAVGPANPDNSSDTAPPPTTPNPEPWCEATQDTRWHCPGER